MRTVTIELFKEAMKFSAGHFTVFSATERERLHGHNFTVYCALTGRVGHNGMVGDYGPYKRMLFDLCARWNEYFLLPGNSPYVRICDAASGATQDSAAHARIDVMFADEVIPFLKKDVLILPVTNVTLEELSALMLQEITAQTSQLASDGIDEIVLKIASGPGQSASATWRRHEA